MDLGYTIIACAISGTLIGIILVLKEKREESTNDILHNKTVEPVSEQTSTVDPEYFIHPFEKGVFVYAMRRWLPPAYNFRTHMRGSWATLKHDGTGRFARLHFMNGRIRINPYPYQVSPILRWVGILSIFFLLGWLVQSSNALVILALAVAAYFLSAFIWTSIKLASKAIYHEKVEGWLKEVHGLLEDVAVRLKDEQEQLKKMKMVEETKNGDLDGASNEGFENPNTLPEDQSMTEDASNKPSYILKVYDNYHYMDESSVTGGTPYNSREAALKAAKDIVDDSLIELREPGMSAAELYGRYRMFGEDPCIISNVPGESVGFSASGYAEQKARDMVEGNNNPAKEAEKEAEGENLGIPKAISNNYAVRVYYADDGYDHESESVVVSRHANSEDAILSAQSKIIESLKRLYVEGDTYDELMAKDKKRGVEPVIENMPGIEPVSFSASSFVRSIALEMCTEHHQTDLEKQENQSHDDVSPTDQQQTEVSEQVISSESPQPLSNSETETDYSVSRDEEAEVKKVEMKLPTPEDEARRLLPEKLKNACFVEQYGRKGDQGYSDIYFSNNESDIFLFQGESYNIKAPWEDFSMDESGSYTAKLFYLNGELIAVLHSRSTSYTSGGTRKDYDSTKFCVSQDSGITWETLLQSQDNERFSTYVDKVKDLVPISIA